MWRQYDRICSCNIGFLSRWVILNVPKIHSFTYTLLYFQKNDLYFEWGLLRITNNYHKLQNKIYYFLRCVWQLPSNSTKSWFVAWHGCVMTFAFSYLFVHFYILLDYFCYPFLFKKYCSTKGSLSFKFTSFITQSDCFSFRLFVHALVYQSFRELSNKDTPWFMFLNKITELYQSF